uniref:Apple domain-containing protein n=1 Tax=Ascaris lumbricoides TaxID=6252 RepID=A0A0M3ITR0_ASCLU
MYTNLSREECRECLLNKDDHFGKYDLVYDLTAEYHFINCSEPLFSTRSMNECRKQFHQTINEQTATKVFSHSFAATLPIFSTSALSGRNRIGVSDFRKTNKATTTTSSSSSTTLEPSLSSRESEATDIRWLMKTSYERVIAFESTPKRIFHSVTTATTQPMTSAELNIFTTPMDASFTNSEAQWEVLTTNKDDSNTTSSTSKSSKGSSDSREFLTASARSVTTATLSTIYTRPNEAVTGTLKKTRLEGIEANRSTEIVEVEFTPSRETLLSQQTFPQMRNSVGPIQSQKADVKGLRNESTKPTSERTTTELASESRAIDSAESTPESGEIDSVETTLANRVTDPTETTSESRATEPTESIPESEETDSAESTTEGGATDSTESTPERSTSATAESASENRTTWLKQSVAEGELLEATTETSAESSTTSVNAMAIELQQIGNRFTPKTPENEEDDKKNERATSTPSIKSNKNNNVIIDESEISESMTSSTSTQSCFEVSAYIAFEHHLQVLDGFLMKSTAGGLENDVSLEECKCFCATSRISSRYSFQCASATYYHNERDCVLNLDSRIQRINLLRENFQTAFNVTYIGLLCSPGRLNLLDFENSKK